MTWGRLNLLERLMELILPRASQRTSPSSVLSQLSTAETIECLCFSSELGELSLALSNSWSICLGRGGRGGEGREGREREGEREGGREREVGKGYLIQSECWPVMQCVCV